MRGKPGTSIELTVIRKGEMKPLVFKIVRDIIEIKSVYTKRIGDDILYLRVTSFDQKVVSRYEGELIKVATLKLKGIKVLRILRKLIPWGELP